MTERYCVVKLKRSRKRAMLVGTGGRLLRDRDEVDAAIKWAFAQGWKEADITYCYADPTTRGCMLLVEYATNARALSTEGS
jgi:hypothetical protein